MLLVQLSKMFWSYFYSCLICYLLSLPFFFAFLEVVWKKIEKKKKENENLICYQQKFFVGISLWSEGCLVPKFCKELNCSTVSLVFVWYLLLLSHSTSSFPSSLTSDYSSSHCILLSLLPLETSSTVNMFIKIEYFACLRQNWYRTELCTYRWTARAVFCGESIDGVGRNQDFVTDSKELFSTNTHLCFFSPFFYFKNLYGLILYVFR